MAHRRRRFGNPALVHHPSPTGQSLSLSRQAGVTGSSPVPPTWKKPRFGGVFFFHKLNSHRHPKLLRAHGCGRNMYVLLRTLVGLHVAGDKVRAFPFLPPGMSRLQLQKLGGPAVVTSTSNHPAGYWPTRPRGQRSDNAALSAPAAMGAPSARRSSLAEFERREPLG
jgi:hypothetical protein